MIHPDSRTLSWIEQVAKDNKIKDITLVEKTIRAFSLLEALARSGCPFLFKGGSSLMLHLDTGKRLSIDIDIICPPGTRIEDYLEKYSEEYGFGEVKLVERISRTDIFRNNTPNSFTKWHIRQEDVRIRFCWMYYSRKFIMQM
ncbi:nucleotidyl transferase AbiEii/AbiGii toxin family protein [Phocaeicola vulgatus]|uniref:nucleotidyl transferase AbiEii/AbiGii toxin family protein n=1 Tax=Phocaeicola vulgatus TaxID=821 RepID=UPI0035627D95